MWLYNQTDSTVAVQCFVPPFGTGETTFIASWQMGYVTLPKGADELVFDRYHLVLPTSDQRLERNILVFVPGAVGTKPTYFVRDSLRCYQEVEGLAVWRADSAG